MKSHQLITIILSLGFTSSMSGQKLNYEISDNPSRMFDLENYERAKELYRKKYKKDFSDIKVKYHFGICLAYTYEVEDGIKFLEEVSVESSTPKEVWFHLARAYHLGNRFDKAISTYKKYIETPGAKEDLISQAKRNVEMCNNAKVLIKKPLNIEFENLGKRVNSLGREYLPLITPDESMLLYSTRRAGTTGKVYDLQGYHTADILLSKYKYGKWSRARSIGYPNSYGNEQTSSISENGKYAIYYVNNPNSKNNLQISTKTKSSFKRSEKIDSEQINLNSSEQISAAISDDLDYLIFSSNRPGGIGGTDLYICKKLPDNTWAQPINMGDKINTPFDDAYPYFRNKGKELYFSSKGHNSMGGYDFFISTLDSATQEWSSPKNVGYPLNTSDDNIGITFTENKKYAYISTNRKDSYGGLDIYKVDFKNEEPNYTTVKGYLLDADSNLYKAPLIIELFDVSTGELYGLYEVNEEKGDFLMILPPNKYEVNIDIPEKGYFKTPFIVEGRNKYRKEIKRNIRVIFKPKE